MKKKQEEIKDGPLKTVLYVIAIVGAALTIFTELSHYYPALMELCGGSKSGCADVASTPYSKMFGVSVAYWGLLTYITYIYLLRYFPQFTLPFSAVLMGSEFYFLWIMASVIQIFCTFCLIQFATVAVLFTLTVIWQARRGDYSLPGGVWVTPVIVLISFAAFAAPVKLSASKTVLTTDGLVTYEGNVNAKIKVEVFSDYQCGYCKKFEPEIEKIRKQNPDVLIIYRDYIIPSHQISPVAVSYANAIAMTRGADVFVAARKALYENQDRLYDYLKDRLPDVTFTDDLKAKIKTKVDADMSRANKVGIYQTPSLAVSRGGELIQVVRGYAEYEKFSGFLK